MQKLVTKNPVQRFKQGRKIIKAQYGNLIENPTPIIDPETGEYYFGEWEGGNLPVGSKLVRDADSIRSRYLSWRKNDVVANQNNSYLVKGRSGSTQILPVNKSGISFKQAFNQARNSGLKEFSWGGKRFNTQKKGEEGFIWSNGKWINPNIKFVAPLPTDMTPEEANELNKKAKPIVTQPTIQQNDFARDKQNYYPSAATNTVSYNPNFNWKEALKEARNLHYNTQFVKKGTKLLSRNPFQRFKSINFRQVTTLKTGGLIPKYQGGTNSSWKKDWSKETPVGQELTDRAVESVRKVTKPIEESTKKAAQKNSKMLELQLGLWNSGAFKGVIDKKTGKQVTYERAVDGYNGEMTQQAMENNKKRREAIPLSPREEKQIEQQSVSTASLLPNSVSNIKNWINNKISSFGINKAQYIDSKNKDLQAIQDHSRQLNNNYTYTYLDRINNKVRWIRNGEIVDSAGIVSGVNDKSDGYTHLSMDSKGRPLYDRSLNLSATPAGVFVLSRPYKGDIYKKGSLMYHLIEAKGDNEHGRATPVAFHYAPESRKKQMSEGLKKLSFGCVYGDCDESQQKIDKYISQGDTVYSQPVEPGNYLYEENGKIKPHYVSTSPYASGKVWGKEFNLNNVIYNTGY